MVRCSACGKEESEGNRFCGACGAALPPSTDAPTESIQGRLPSSSADPRAADHGRFVPGTTLGGRYRITGLLGRGGMGEVYRADDLKLGQEVALKFLPQNVEQDPRRLERFLGEVRTARHVTHPNVCRVYDIDEIDGRHFLSMEYVDGEDLSTLLHRIGRLPSEKATQIARQLCSGLAAAHEQGIVHRDLKPANVMLDGQGRVRITDFGLAGWSETIGDDVVAGTPAYMAPEQLKGESVDARSDLYALGLVLYELYTGKRAHTAPTRAGLLEEKQSSPTTPSSLVDDLDPSVERVILRCLEAEPRERPKSALAIAAALPGGDPLAAALAAGETPSPEMVAGAVSEEAIHPRVAVAFLIAALAGLWIATLSQSRMFLQPQAPVTTPPSELAIQARSMLSQLGYEDLPDHRASGLRPNSMLLDQIARTDPSPDRWRRLRDARPPAHTFWLRYSAIALQPPSIHQDTASRDGPPFLTPGSLRIELDPQGRLFALEAVPTGSPESLSSGAEVDWAVPFGLAGIDLDGANPTEPVRGPSVPTDRIAAWTTSLDPANTGEEVVVQAGALGGRLAYFEILPGYTVPGAELSTEGFDPGPGVVLLYAVMVLSAVYLARRNSQLGRADRRGAARLAVVAILGVIVPWFLSAVRLEALDLTRIAYQITYGKTLGHALVHGVILWVVYLAIEPFVRRLWPHNLVSWNRLLLGRFRDPLIGRDVLIGFAVFPLASLGNLLSYYSLEWTGSPPVRPLSVASDFGVGETLNEGLALLIESVPEAAVPPMAFLVLILMFRFVLRRTWLAVGLLLAILTTLMVLALLPELASPDAATITLLACSGLFFFGLHILVLLRFGLLAMMVLWLLGHYAGMGYFTFDLTTWYGGTTLLFLTVYVALLAYGFVTALGGRKLFAEVD